MALGGVKARPCTSLPGGAILPRVAMKLPHRARGLVWVVVGLLLYLVPLAIGRPLVVRGTKIPWGLTLSALGLILLAWDGWRLSKRKGSDRN
jgi:hypothetical protein